MTDFSDLASKVDSLPEDVREQVFAAWKRAALQAFIGTHGKSLGSAMVDSLVHFAQDRGLDPELLVPIHVWIDKEGSDGKLEGFVALGNARGRRHNNTEPLSTPAIERAPNDDAFLADLPTELYALGRSLLEGVRRHYSGRFVYSSKSGRHVAYPDNFVAFKIQPRDESIRVTVRGDPAHFDVPKDIELRADRRSYSAFKIKRRDQVDSALTIIRNARRKL